jgi:hypothetical protein
MTLDENSTAPHTCLVSLYQSRDVKGASVTIGGADYSKTNYLERIAIALEELIKLLKDE